MLVCAFAGALIAAAFAAMATTNAALPILKPMDASRLCFGTSAPHRSARLLAKALWNRFFDALLTAINLRKTSVIVIPSVDVEPFKELSGRPSARTPTKRDATPRRRAHRSVRTRTVNVSCSIGGLGGAPVTEPMGGGPNDALTR